MELLNNKEVDAVLISSPAYTHADYMEAAALSGKHIYCEKPVSPDVAGCRKMEKVGERFDKKLSMTIGFQIRYATPYAQMIARIHNGDIGKVLSAQLYYLATQGRVVATPGKSYDEKRIRNQYHFHALSGGTLLDQSIHMIDVCNWALREHPDSAIGYGGIDESQKFGDTWKHFQVAINIHPQMLVFRPRNTGPPGEESVQNLLEQMELPKHITREEYLFQGKTNGTQELSDMVVTKLLKSKEGLELFHLHCMMPIQIKDQLL